MKTEPARLGFGTPTPDLYERLFEVPLAAKIAWHEAQADPSRAEEILDEWSTATQSLLRIATLHLMAGAERAAAKQASHDRATLEAEARVRRGLAVAATSVLGEDFDLRGLYVYCLWGTGTEKPLYVGKSTNILSRLGVHMGNTRRRARIQRITLLRCKTEHQMDETEWRLIKEYQPELNTMGIDSTAPIGAITNIVYATPPFNRRRRAKRAA